MDPDLLISVARERTQTSRGSPRSPLHGFHRESADTGIAEDSTDARSERCARIRGSETAQERRARPGEERQDHHESENVEEDRQESCRRLPGNPVVSRFPISVFRIRQWMPLLASQRSASMAALQPSPAAETA